MEEKDILLKTIEGLNASIASLSATNKDQAEQITYSGAYPFTFR